MTLLTEGKIAASSQNQSLSAILFLYRQVLNQEVDRQINVLGSSILACTDGPKRNLIYC